MDVALQTIRVMKDRVIVTKIMNAMGILFVEKIIATVRNLPKAGSTAVKRVNKYSTNLLVNCV